MVGLEQLYLQPNSTSRAILYAPFGSKQRTGQRRKAEGRARPVNWQSRSQIYEYIVRIKNLPFAPPFVHLQRT